MLTLTFARRHVILLVICTTLLSVLLVCAGYLLGYGRVAAAKPSANLAPTTPAASPVAVHPTPPLAGPASTPASPETQNAASADPGSSDAGAAVSAAPTQIRSAVWVPKSSISDQASAVASPSKSAPTTATAPEAAARRYELQFGIFDEKPGAEARIKSLKESSVTAELFTASDAAGITHFAVRTGSYPDLISATKAAQALTTQTGEFIVVRPADRL